MRQLLQQGTLLAPGFKPLNEVAVERNKVRGAIAPLEDAWRHHIFGPNNSKPQH